MISPDSGTEYTVENEPGAELPSTGGPGIKIFYILGILLTCFAGAGMLMRSPRREV
jgi:hypothetical protein